MLVASAPPGSCLPGTWAHVLHSDALPHAVKSELRRHLFSRRQRGALQYPTSHGVQANKFPSEVPLPVPGHTPPHQLHQPSSQGAAGPRQCAGAVCLARHKGETAKRRAQVQFLVCAGGSAMKQCQDRSSDQ